MTTFAIVIPNRNQSHFLPTALESLRHQSQPFYLAVMDAGSTDGFKEVAEKYKDIITHLRSENDNGQAAAIKEGKEAVAGDIVSWLNADDYYFPDTLEKVAACFEKHPDIDVVYGDAIHVTPDGFFISYFPDTREFDADYLTRNCFICQPACFVRRSAYTRVDGLNPELHYTMDWDLWCRLAKQGAKFKYLKEVLAAVRYYPGTKTLSVNKKRYLELYRIEREYGGRLLPRSWIGAYYYTLKCNSEETAQPSIAVRYLSFLRQIWKNILSATSDKTDAKQKYGFQTWTRLVDGTGTIYMPWYTTPSLKKLSLKVKPRSNNFEVIINNKPCITQWGENYLLHIYLPTISSQILKLSIRCLDKWQWEFIALV